MPCWGGLTPWWGVFLGWPDAIVCGVLMALCALGPTALRRFIISSLTRAALFSSEGSRIAHAHFCLSPAKYFLCPRYLGRF